jgi:2',3'-cyclic-nucleotide 2'-phosphodiesterase (5'-nucleotidase family)
MPVSLQTLLPGRPPRRALRPSLFAAALLLAGCAPPAVVPAPEPAEAVKRVRIVHTNDFHGRLHPQSPAWAEGRGIGGSAVLAAHFDSARVRFDGPTLVLSGGDDWQGTAISNMTWGRAVVAVMNAKRYDAAALGNHEFDWGLDTLRVRRGEERFPRMGANVYLPGTREHPAWVRPWAMLERDGVRTAVIGLVTAETPNVVMAGRVDGLEFGDEAEAIDRYAREARAAGADFVVVTMHEGAVCEAPGDAPEDESRGCRGRMIEIAQQLTERVDLIVGGHTHQRVLTTVNGIAVAETAPYSVEYTVTDLEKRGDSTIVTYRAVRRSWADEVTPDTMVARIVAEMDEAIRPIAGREIVRLASELSNRNRAPGEYPLGNLLADAQRISTAAHVSLVNNGSLRRSLPAGPVSYGVLYEFQPFQNELVAVELTGAQLRSALEHALTDDGLPTAHISGLTVRYDAAAPRGSRVREMRLDDGRVLRDTDPVTLGTTEFVAAGGDGFTVLREGTQNRTGLVDLDALVTYLQSLPQPIQPPGTGRWVRR